MNKKKEFWKVLQKYQKQRLWGYRMVWKEERMAKMKLLTLIGASILKQKEDWILQHQPYHQRDVNPMNSLMELEPGVELYKEDVPIAILDGLSTIC